MGITIKIKYALRNTVYFMHENKIASGWIKKN